MDDSGLSNAPAGQSACRAVQTRRHARQQSKTDQQILVSRPLILLGYPLPMDDRGVERVNSDLAGRPAPIKGSSRSCTAP